MPRPRTVCWTRLPSLDVLTQAIFQEWVGLRADLALARAAAFRSDRVAFSGRTGLAFGSSRCDRAHGDAVGVAGFDVDVRPTRMAAKAVARAVLDDTRDQMATAEAA